MTFVPNFKNSVKVIIEKCLGHKTADGFKLQILGGVINFPSLLNSRCLLLKKINQKFKLDLTYTLGQELGVSFTPFPI